MITSLKVKRFNIFNKDAIPKLSGNVIIYTKYVNENRQTRHTKSNTFPVLHVHVSFFFYFLFYFYKKCSTVLIASPQISVWKCYQIKHWDKVLFYNCLTETCNEVQKLYAFASRTLLFLFSLGKTSEDRLSTKIDRSKGEKKWRVRCLLIRAATVCSWISIANSSSLKYLPNCDQQQQQQK